MQRADSKDSKLKKSDIKNYTLEAQIGHGASGVCYKAISKLDGSICAIKKISINTIKGNSLKLALKQVEVLKALNHPSIIKYYDSFADQAYLYIVMQYAQKGDLHSMLKRRKIKQQFYSENQIWDMARQLLQALKYLHSKSIVHRDFKTLNIFIGQKNNLLVGDLGVSKIIKNDMGLYSRVGTPLYLAPEIIKYQKYDYKADIWGLGCVLYIVTSLTHPFQGKNIINLGQNILFNEPKPIPNYSNQLNSFLKLLLQKNPSKRPQAKFLLTSFFSPQIQKSRNTHSQQRKCDQIQSIKKIQTKINTFVNVIQSPRKLKKISPSYCSDLQLKQIKNSGKDIAVQQKQINDDITIILQPSSSKNDMPQQKTRIRALFNNSKQWPISNRFDDNQIERQKLLYVRRESQGPVPQFKRSSQSLIKPRSEAQKVQTQCQQKLQKRMQQQQSYFKRRDIQSAKYRSNPIAQRQFYSSCQKIQKPCIVGSVSRMFFQAEAQKQSKKMATRPKSGLGRKVYVTHNDIKYVKRSATFQDPNISQMKTQLLRKPQMIII